MISKPGVWGVGNGCLQDILFKAGLHPRRRIGDVRKAEKRAFYEAITGILEKVTDRAGRDTDCDLYGKPGGYASILDRRSVGKPCPRCGTAIEKVSYLGGASYFCPSCQT